MNANAILVQKIDNFYFYKHKVIFLHKSGANLTVQIIAYRRQQPISLSGT